MIRSGHSSFNEGLNDKYVRYKVERDNYKYHSSGKSIGLYIERSDGVRLHQPEWFPLSQVTVKDSYSGNIEVTIPKWLLDKKLLPGFRIIGLKL